MSIIYFNIYIGKKQEQKIALLFPPTFDIMGIIKLLIVRGVFMNVATLITIGLYLPFALLLAIFAIVYLIVGYKKGMGQSLFSFVATIIAIGVSLTLTKGLAVLLAKPVTATLPKALVDQVPSVAQGFIQGGVEIVLSYCLFWALLIVALIVLKSVVKRPAIEAKSQKLNVSNGASRAIGSLIRGVDALLVVLMLLLPLYGGIATTMPTVKALVQLSEMAEENADREEDMQMLNAMADHPVVALYRHGPGGWVNGWLTSFTINGKTTNIVAAADGVTGLLERTGTLKEALNSKDKQAALDASQDLVNYARDNVINERWFYSLVMTTADNLQEKVETQVDGADRYSAIGDLLDMPIEDFQANADIVLDFTSDYLDIYSNCDDISDLNSAEVKDDLEELYANLQEQNPQAQELTDIVLGDVLGLLPNNSLNIDSIILDDNISNHVDLGDLGDVVNPIIP